MLYLVTRSLDPTGVGRARSQRSTRSRRGVVWCRCAASAVVGASTRRVRGYPGDRTVLRHKPHRRSGQGVWVTPQRWRKSTEGCRMA